MTEEVLNTLSVQNNVSAATDWPSPTLSPICGDGIISWTIYPGDLKTAAAVDSYDASHPPHSYDVSCSPSIKTASYSFAPRSDNVTERFPNSPATFEFPGIAITSEDYDTLASQVIPFYSNQYTIVAGDILGSYVFLDFAV